MAYINPTITTPCPWPNQQSCLLSMGVWVGKRHIHMKKMAPSVLLPTNHHHHLLLLLLLLLLLGLSSLLSLGAVPVSRSVGLRVQEPVPVLHVTEDQPILAENDEDDEAFVAHGRMDFESNDYTGSGANNRHDPRVPGRA